MTAKDRSRKVNPAILVVIAMVLIILLHNGPQITGTYSAEGDYKLVYEHSFEIRSQELIPIDSILRFSIGNNSLDIELSSLINSTGNGSYNYGSLVNGSGEGYGPIGLHEKIIDINYTLIIENETINDYVNSNKEDTYVIKEEYNVTGNVTITEKNNKVTISTNLTETKEGYGFEFKSLNPIIIDISVESYDWIVDRIYDNIVISVIYNNTELSNESIVLKNKNFIQLDDDYNISVEVDSNVTKNITKKGSKYDVNLSCVNNSVVLKGVEKNNNVKVKFFKDNKDYRLSSDIVFINSSYDQSQIGISLTKKDNVEKIFSCEFEDWNGTDCHEWNLTDIVFEKNQNKINFVVDFYKIYAAGVKDAQKVKKTLAKNKEWNIKLNTVGSSNLVVESKDVIEVISISCGSEVITNSSSYLNYSCKNETTVKVDVSSPGLHRVKVKYGNKGNCNESLCYYEVVDDFDKDGISDSEDIVEGESSDVKGNINTKLLMSGNDTLRIVDNIEVVVEVQVDSSVDIFPLNVTVIREKEGRGKLLVNGLSGLNKTFFVDKVVDSDALCVKNAEIKNLSQISENCNASDEILFNNCTIYGQEIDGITCYDKFDYYEISGLMNSAVTEFGNSKLKIWAEGIYHEGRDIVFKANYSNITSGDAVGDCDIWFNDTGWFNMSLVSGLQTYNRNFSVGLYSWNVSCTSPTFDNLELNDLINISSTNIRYLSCSTRSSCEVGETDVVHLAYLENSHIELSNNSAYSNKVCCKDVLGGNEITVSYGNGDAGIVNLAQESNSHAEFSYLNNYENKVFLNSSSDELKCGYSTSNCDVAGYDTCLFSMAYTTNSHVADCSEYSNKVCCGFNVSYLPIYTEFIAGSNTTDFSEFTENTIDQVSNLTLENTFGQIKWLNNQSARLINFNDIVEIADKMVSVNVSGLNNDYNSSSKILIKGVNCTNFERRKLLIANGVYSNKEQIFATGKTCPNNICTQVSCGNNNLEFTAAHFTGYAYGATSNLTIDNNGPGEVDVDITFNASYINSSGGVGITGAACNITTTEHSNQVMSDVGLGNYEINLSFTQNGTFEYNVTCNKVGFTQLTAYDNVTVEDNSLNCGTLNSANTVYTMTKDLESEGTCFTIGADNITLDGAGFTINYAAEESGSGVYNYDGYDMTNIKNLNIIQNSSSSSSYAIYLRFSINSVISNNTLITYGNDSYVIYLVGNGDGFNAGNNVIYNNNIYGRGVTGGVGLFPYYSSNNSITHNLFNCSGDGFSTYNTGDYNTVEYNNFTGFSGTNSGVRIRGTKGQIIRNNRMFGNLKYGINLYQTINLNEIYNNTINTTQTGVNNYASHHQNIYDNRITSSGIGYYSDYAQNISIYNNYISSNSSNVIHVIHNSNGVNISRNIVTGYSPNYLIFIQSSYDSVDISNNDMSFVSDELGIGIATYNNYESLNMYISENNITKCNIGISLNSNHNNNTIYKNRIDTTNSTLTYSKGINVRSSDNNNFSHNIINTSSAAYSHGIYLYENSANNIIDSNDITTTAANCRGIVLDNAKNTIVKYNNLSSTLGDAIGLWNSLSTNNTFKANNIFDSGYNQLVISTSGVLGTKLIDQPILDYNLVSGSGLIVEDTNYGKIEFIETVSGSGTDLSSVIYINNNSANVESLLDNGFNVSANITIYGADTFVLSNPAVLKDGKICSDCYNFTALDSSTAKFNVSSWTEYSLGEGNTPPTAVTLILPTDGNESLFNREVYFNWTDSTDVDLDNITYRILIDDSSTFNIPEIDVALIEDSNYTSSTLEVDTIYYWKVISSDGIETTNSSVFNFTIVSTKSINVIVSGIDFGTLDEFGSGDTSNDSPGPIVIENNGNVPINVSVYGTTLWKSIANPSSYYQFKIGVYEIGSYNVSASVGTYKNVSISSTDQDIVDLNYVDSSDTAEIDINVTVPATESAGDRYSNITIIAS